MNVRGSVNAATTRQRNFFALGPSAPVASTGSTPKGTIKSLMLKRFRWERNFSLSPAPAASLTEI